MALTYNKQNRDLSIKGLITCNDGTQINILSEDIVSYSVNSSAGSEGIPLGTVDSASFSLTLNNAGRRFTPEQLDNAEVHMFVGIMENGEYVYSDCGTWYVSDSTAPEQSVIITINGNDALATRFEAYYDDQTDKGTSIGDIVGGVAALAGITLESDTFYNSNIKISKAVKWPEETTLRDVISYCAVVAAGFARINPNGKLEIVSYADGASYEIGPDMYKTFTPTGGYAFNFNRIEVYLKDDDEERTPFYPAGGQNISPNATNTIQLDYNPLLNDAIVSTIVDKLNGIRLECGSMTWGGDPVVKPGDKFEITDLEGIKHLIMVNSHNLTFNGGLSATESCNLPALNTQGSDTYSTSANMYDSKGRLRATRISGLDKSIVKATIGHFEQVTAETVQTDELLASFLSTIELLAGTIDANSISTSKLTATAADILKATIDNLDAVDIQADSLKAELARLFEVVANKIKATDVEADAITTQMANIVSAKIDIADIGYGQIKDLDVDEAIITDGVAGALYIDRLTVTSANILNATLGNLILKGDDGLYYKVSVTSGGTIGVEAVSMSELEAEGRTQQIVDEIVNVGEISAKEIKGKEAIFESVFTKALSAGQITANQAMLASAVIPNLTVSTITAAGNSIEVSAGQMFEILLNGVQNLNQWFGFGVDGLTIRQPAITKPDGEVIPQSDWYTVTDNRGYHIKNATRPEDVGSFELDRFKTEAIQMGDMICRPNTRGGWTWRSMK